MSTGIQVDGLPEFQRTSAAAARELEHLDDAHRDAGQLLAERGKANAPRVSGRLADGVTYESDGVSTTLTDTEVYAAVIHNGWPARNITAQPWLAETVSDNQSDVIQVFEHELAEIVSHIHGK